MTLLAVMDCWECDQAKKMERWLLSLTVEQPPQLLSGALLAPMRHWMESLCQCVDSCRAEQDLVQVVVLGVEQALQSCQLRLDLRDCALRWNSRW